MIFIVQNKSLRSSLSNLSLTFKNQILSKNRLSAHKYLLAFNFWIAFFWGSVEVCYLFEKKSKRRLYLVTFLILNNNYYLIKLFKIWVISIVKKGARGFGVYKQRFHRCQDYWRRRSFNHVWFLASRSSEHRRRTHQNLDILHSETRILNWCWGKRTRIFNR